MKDNLFLVHYDQLENQITESFIKLLKHSTSDLTSDFLSFFGIAGDYGDFIYDFQYGKEIQLDFNRAVLLGIAEFDTIEQSRITDDLDNKDGIPDGYIHAQKGGLSILIEIKRGLGKLNQNQINAHKKRFGKIENVEEKIITWKNALEFFVIQKEKYERDHRNYLLLEQFLFFCHYYFIGDEIKNVSPSRILEREDEKDFIKSLDKYIVDKYSVIPVTKNAAIDYYYKDQCFFTIWYSRRLLILKIKSPWAVILDLLIANVFGKVCSTSYDNKTQEAFIHFEWIQTYEQLKSIQDMISICYDSKANNLKINLNDFMSKHQINVHDLKKSRLGREDISFLNKKRKMEKLLTEINKCLKHE